MESQEFSLISEIKRNAEMSLKYKVLREFLGREATFEDIKHCSIDAVPEGARWLHYHDLCLGRVELEVSHGAFDFSQPTYSLNFHPSI